jgi:hypothetical protein
VEAAVIESDPMTKKISVLVPVKSRVESLRDLFEEARAPLGRRGVEVEFVYLVGTPDDHVLEQVREIHAAEPACVRVLQFAQPIGEAAMLSAGMERSDGDVLFTLPSFFETDLSVLPKLFAAIRDGADLAFASRITGGRQGSRWQSRVFNRLLSWAAGSRFADIANGTRAIRRHVLEEVPVYGDFHRYLPLLAERMGFRVREVPAGPHPRLRASHVHPPRTYLWRFTDLLSVLFVSRFTRYPLRLFGGLGSAFAAVGGAMLLVLGVQRLLGTPLADRPALVLATLLLGLGVQAFTIGLLGELILYFQARNVRDYRITAVLESDPPPLAPRTKARGPEGK